MYRLHVLWNLSRETEKIATNVSLLNSTHKRPEPQSDLKHLVENQSHYETDLNGEIKGGWAFEPKVSQMWPCLPLATKWPEPHGTETKPLWNKSQCCTETCLSFCTKI